MVEVKDRVGEVFFHPKYGEYIIVGYNNCEDVKIKFANTGYEYNTSYNHIKNLEVSDLYYKGKYGNHKGTREVCISAYKTWYNMIYRCEHNSGYEEAVVCEQWKDFSSFLEWYKQQFKEEGWHLDKDVLSNGGGLYSPSTCCFLPPEINTFFEKHKKAKGFSFNKRRKKYEAYCRNKGRHIHLGMYDTPAEARIAYIEYKRELFEELIFPYLDRINVQLYNAMKRYLW